MICHHCHKQVQITNSISFRAECNFCLSYLHCCLNCRFYDAEKANSCLEPQAEWITEKDQANFCEYFEPAAEAAATSQENIRLEALKKFNALFKE